MTFARRFLLIILGLCLIPALLWSVPLQPATEAQLRKAGQLNNVRAAFLDASLRGVNQPTTRPIDIRWMAYAEDQLELRVLTILVDFDDNPANTSQYPAEHYNEMLYSVDTFPTGSVTDYYLENSYSNVRITGEAVGWYRMPHSYAYYVDGSYGFGLYPQNSQLLAEDAVAAADPDVDFSQYDNDNDGYVDALFIVHAGPGAEQTGSSANFWSHAWVTHNVPNVDDVQVYSYTLEPENGNIGVFVHELGHSLFGLQDLYDYGYDSKGTGDWSVMSGGVWANSGKTPVHLDAWSKIQAGFVEPHNVDSDEINVSIPSVETDGVIYRLWSMGTLGPQYFLVESRQQTGFDQYLPGSGLIIYHIDETAGNNNNQWYPGITTEGHYLVAIEQADGDWDLEHNYNSDSSDPWPGESGNRIFDCSSIPNSNDYDGNFTDIVIDNITDNGQMMTADFQIGFYNPSGQDLVLSPDETSLTLPAQGGTLNFTAEINNHEELVYTTQFWIKVILPNGTSFGPIFGPVNLTVSSLSNLEGSLSQCVPARAPNGLYTLVGYIGNCGFAIDDSSFFTFIKMTENGESVPGPADIGWEVDGSFSQPEAATSPQSMYLLSAYPNPFNPETTISFNLSVSEYVRLTVFDISGREIATLVDGFRSEGHHDVSFNAAGLTSDVYVYRLNTNEQTVTGKMVLMK